MAKILVIDDDPEICSLLQDFLSILHHEVRTATRGGEGLALLEEWQPDLLLLDIQMPGMDGIEVLRRAQEIRRDIGAIFITGILDRDVLARAMALNPYTYLHKPFELQHLAAIIESYLRQHPPAPS